MKLLLPILLAMTGLAFAQDEAPQTSTDKSTIQSKGVQVDPSDLPGTLEKLLQTYKQTLVDAKPILDAADVQIPKEVFDAQNGVSASTLDKQAQAAADPLHAKSAETGVLKAGSLQTGGLPLTLPSVDPTTEPAGQYQMWRKAERDKAVRDRYLELRRSPRADLNYLANP